MGRDAPPPSGFTPAVTTPSPNPLLDSFTYDDAIVRQFMLATFVWGLVGMLVGLTIALELVLPSLNVAPWLSFGRLRPLHTNAVIFAFAGNAFFTGAYYSLQRLCKARMFSDALSKFHFWGWQAIIVAAAVTLPLGFTQAKEYAELEWPIDIAIAVVWVAFAVNMFGTIARRRERHLGDEREAICGARNGAPGLGRSSEHRRKRVQTVSGEIPERVRDYPTESRARRPRNGR